MKRIFWIGFLLLNLIGCRPSHRYDFRDTEMRFNGNEYIHSADYLRDGKVIGGAHGERWDGYEGDTAICSADLRWPRDHREELTIGPDSSYANAEIWLEENCK